MPKNPTPSQDSILKNSFSTIIQGCVKLESSLGIRQNTSQVLQQTLDDIDSTQKSLNLEKRKLAKLRADFDSADRNGRKVISNCRLRLAKLFGQDFNKDWEKAGFPDQSTAVPESLDKRQALLLSLEKYFNSNPEHQSLDMDATADQCREAWDQVSLTRSEVEKQIQVRAKAVKLRNQSRMMLRKRYRSLIVELGLLITNDDPRWMEFGLNPPTRVRRTKAELAIAAQKEASVEAESDDVDDDSIPDEEIDEDVPPPSAESVTVGPGDDDGEFQPREAVESESASLEPESFAENSTSSAGSAAAEPQPSLSETEEAPRTGNRRRTTSTRTRTDTLEAPSPVTESPVSPGQLEFFLSPEAPEERL